MDKLKSKALSFVTALLLVFTLLPLLPEGAISADALAGGVYAAINRAPLFLVNGKLKTPQLNNEQKSYLKTKTVKKITAFGGVGAVPDNHIADIAKNAI